MNIRFKMPRFGRNLTNRGVVKELLLTTLATTISIVLTFGTAHFVEQRQNDEARRLLAMTIICDIDETLGVFKRLLDIEDKGSTISYFLLNNMDRLESISDDTLFVFFNEKLPRIFVTVTLPRNGFRHIMEWYDFQAVDQVLDIWKQRKEVR